MSHPAVAVHRFRRMVGRDPQEQGRTATTLELLFDLTVVVAFSAAAAQLAHLLAEGHLWSGIVWVVAYEVWATATSLRR